MRYVTHFSQSLDFETRPYEVRVLVSCPGQVATAFRERASLGHDRHQRDYQTLSVEKAAHFILQQIAQKKPIQIIDYRYKILVFIARFCIPKKILQSTLQKEIEKRIIPRS